MRNRVRFVKYNISYIAQRAFVFKVIKLIFRDNTHIIRKRTSQLSVCRVKSRSYVRVVYAKINAEYFSMYRRRVLRGYYYSRFKTYRLLRRV